VNLRVPCCGTGEAAWSLAVVHHEEGLADRCEIYATDLPPGCIAEARRGRIGIGRLQAAEARHARTEPPRPLIEHFGLVERGAALRADLLERIVFATHSLATDAPVNEFQFVLCRGVLGRFGPELRSRVQELVMRSLCPLGLVALDPGAGPHLQGLAPFVPEQGVFRRVS
jgi:chemotaxis protein methyltransferase CheR